MPPKKYAELRMDQRCIYDAFKNVSNDTETNMGDFVNSKGYDADANEAVGVLAKRYSLSRIEAVIGDDFNDKSYLFPKNSEVIAVITRAVWALKEFHRLSKGGYVNNAERILNKSPDHVNWHAIYGRVDANCNVTWQDKQNAFPRGPQNGCVAICFIK